MVDGMEPVILVIDRSLERYKMVSVWRWVMKKVCFTLAGEKIEGTDWW
jgi:hypothetical protein